MPDWDAIGRGAPHEQRQSGISLAIFLRLMLRSEFIDTPGRLTDLLNRFREPELRESPSIIPSISSLGTMVSEKISTNWTDGQAGCFGRCDLR
jgi:hypothetical protein